MKIVFPLVVVACLAGTSTFAQSGPPANYDPGPGGSYSANYCSTIAYGDNILCQNVPGPRTTTNGQPPSSPYYQQDTIKAEKWDTKLIIVTSTSPSAGSVQIPGFPGQVLYKAWQTPNSVSSGSGDSGGWNGLEGSLGATILPTVPSTTTPTGYTFCFADMVLGLAQRFTGVNNYIYEFQVNYEFRLPTQTIIKRSLTRLLYAGPLTRDIRPSS
jgi:hypothetical protein